MDEIVKILDKISEYYGHTVAGIVMFILIVVYILFIVFKNYSKVITAYLEKQIKEKDEIHTKATQYRKNVTPQIKQALSDLAKEVNADRALLFEFSNGTSNLIGLPFLYVSATNEVVGNDVIPISLNYQRLNVSVLAEFLIHLEEKGYFYVEDIEQIKNEYPVLYNIFPANSVKSMLFYTIIGLDDTIGFILIASTGDKTFTRDETLPETASTAQVISSYLNYDVLQNEL